MENNLDLKSKTKKFFEQDNLTMDSVRIFFRINYPEFDFDKQIEDKHKQEIEKQSSELKYFEDVNNILKEKFDYNIKMVTLKSEFILKHYDILLENENKLFVVGSTLLITSISIKLDEIININLLMIKNISIILVGVILLLIIITLFFRNKSKSKYINDLNDYIKKYHALKDLEIEKLKLERILNTEQKDELFKDIVSKIKDGFSKTT